MEQIPPAPRGRHDGGALTSVFVTGGEPAPKQEGRERAMEAAWPTTSTRILSLPMPDDPLPTILIRPDTEECARIRGASCESVS